MKKLLLLALGACMFATTSNISAQNFKQSGGEKNLQVLFAPLGGKPISIDGISFRKFNATGDAAWRLNLFIGYTKKTEVLYQANDTNNFSLSGNTFASISGGQSPSNPAFTYGSNPEADKRTTSMTIGIRPGYEMHMAG